MGRLSLSFPRRWEARKWLNPGPLQAFLVSRLRGNDGFGIVVLALVLSVVTPAFSEPASIEGAKGKGLEVEIAWELPVDLDLFLTDPAGETIYFANRKAKSGVVMGEMMGCGAVTQQSSPFRESIKIPSAKPGIYRVSVDFIKDCGSKAVQAAFSVKLINQKTGQLLGSGESKVKYRLLQTVGWEFDIK